MKVIALIPARYQASRLPGKLLLDLNGQSVIKTTYQAVENTQLFDATYVVTDHEAIFKEMQSFGGNVVMSEGTFECGTDRIASVLDKVPDADIYINVQGDEPFTTKASLALLIAAFKEDIEKKIGVATLKQLIKEEAAIHNPNVVKIVTNAADRAIYFSRAPIPYNRDGVPNVAYYKHIGIYAFRKQALIDFARLPLGVLEQIEKLENLRFLEHDIAIKALTTTDTHFGIDTQADLDAARAFLKQQ